MAYTPMKAIIKRNSQVLNFQIGQNNTADKPKNSTKIPNKYPKLIVNSTQILLIFAHYYQDFNL
jgi:hypothetical protein